MQASDYLNSVQTLDGLKATGLKAGTDYVSSVVNVESGLITPVAIASVPALDESQLYYTGGDTHFTANKTEVTIGNYVTLTANVDFKKAYRGKTKNVQLLIDLPQGCEFVEGSLLLSGSLGVYTHDGQRVSVNLQDDGGTVKFCVIPTVPGTVQPGALLQFNVNGKQMTQPIGAAYFEAKALAINVPNI